MTTQSPKTESPQVHLISLGCARNRVDSEVMLGSLLEKGWKITDDAPEANAIIVNTCGFIESAKEESIDTILEAAAHKKTNPKMKLIVTGCLTQRYKTQLAKGLPEVDFFLGVDEFSKIADYVDHAPKGSVHAKRTHYIYTEALPRVNTLNKFSAYVKVAEGCQHNCAFCIIPAIRGRLRSRPIESVVKEVEKLVSQGVLEVNLIAQDLAAYGRDRGQDELLPLLKELVTIDGLALIRLLYVYPENISDEFLDFMADEPKIAKYIDIPVQHASDRLLKSMNRDIDATTLLNVFERVRDRVPGVALRTTVMVGFPGETEEDFVELKAFVKKMKFEHMGCFTYSKEEGTVAGRMAEQIEPDVMKRRQDEIMAIQQKISRDRMESFVGQTLPVLVEGLSPESDLFFQGRLMTQAPEVDGVVFINDGVAIPGQIQMVEITAAHNYDLVGHVVSGVPTTAAHSNIALTLSDKRTMIPVSQNM